MPETIGGYAILNEIGSGGFGTVYRAREPLSRQEFALKLLTRPTGSGFDDPERFWREARLPYEIGHPNIIRIERYSVDGGDRFIVMELMRFSLQEKLRNGRLSLSQSMDICRQVALGLCAAHNHELKITHRDVKPDNILFDSNGVVKVSDFGIAHADNLPGLTATGVGFGPVGYMSPEQAIGAKQVDARADIYSLGATLYEMLTGNRYDPDDSAKASRPAIPSDLERVVNKCLEMDRANRYASMEVLLQEIANPALINRCALIDFYEAMGGPNWKRNDNWLTDAPLGEWDGVTVNRDGVVVGFNASSNNLEGEIPPEITYLTELKELELSDNCLSGFIPPELGSLNELLGLNISENRLLGFIPPELGNLTKLEALGLAENRLLGSIPAELGNLTNLEYLVLCNNLLSGSIPAELGNLTNLENLALYDNLLSGRIPPELGNLTNLNWILLRENNWTDCIPRALFNIPDNDLRKVKLPVCDD